MRRNYALTLTVEELEGIKGKGNVHPEDLPNDILECEGVPGTGIGSREDLLPKVKKTGSKRQASYDQGEEHDDAEYVEENEQEDEGGTSTAREASLRNTRSKANRPESAQTDDNEDRQGSDRKWVPKGGGRSREKEKGKFEPRRKDTSEEDSGDGDQDDDLNTDLCSTNKGDSGVDHSKEDDAMDTDNQTCSNVAADSSTKDVDEDMVDAGELLHGPPRRQKRRLESSGSLDGRRSKSPPRPADEDEGAIVAALTRKSCTRSRQASIGPSDASQAIGILGKLAKTPSLLKENKVAEERKGNNPKEGEVPGNDQGKARKSGGKSRRNIQNRAEGAR